MNANARESGYNPDELPRIANLSNGEVSTPPQLANRILDMMPSDLWSDKKTPFLDPACNSGVLPREIAKRLDKRLEGSLGRRSGTRGPV